MKAWIQAVMNRLGYRIEKIRPPFDRPLDILDMVIRCRGLDRAETFFLQIGANDGRESDPLRSYVEQYHWSGLLVEPVPWLYESLRRNYAGEPRLRFENAAIARQEGQVTIYALRETDAGHGHLPGFAQGLASMDRSVVLRHRRQIPDIERYMTEVSVPAMSVETLLERHGVDRIDLLQIDTEGFDYQVLQMFPFERTRPGVIQYEHFHLSPDDQLAARRLLAERGYRFTTVRGDTIAVREET